MERNEENNMFKFATKELSQDAFICWCINWINYKDEVKDNAKKEKLYELSKKILETILKTRSIKGSQINNVNIIRQFNNIDILVTVTLKNLEQYIIIVEDKTSSNLSERQKKDLYVSKLVKSLKGNIENQHKLNLKEFNEENIVPVFWKTSKWNENKEQLKKELEKNTKKEVICIDGNDTLKLIEEYTQYSDIIKDFFECLEENLRLNNQIPNDEYCIEKIIKNEQIIEGTKFAKNYYAYNCFSKLIGREYSAESHSRRGGIVLRRISEKIRKENILNISNKINSNNKSNSIIAVDTIKSYKLNTTSYKNYFSKDKSEFTEELDQKNIENGNLYTSLRYIFVFFKDLDTFNKARYEFLGLYRLTGYNEKENLRYWKKCNLPNNTVPLNENKIIELISEMENKKD